MRKKIDTHDIHKASLKVFAEYGFKKTTVEDIATELDMTKGNLYFYAKNKKDLYEKSVSYALRHWQGIVRDEVFKESCVKKQLFLMCQKAIDYLDDADELRNILKRDPDIFPMFPANDPYEKINNDSIQLIKAILDKGIKEKVFRPVNVVRISQSIFLIFKMFIIRTYIQDKADKKYVRELYDEPLQLLFLYRKVGCRYTFSCLLHFIDL